jgi:four helix bundle protein
VYSFAFEKLKVWQESRVLTKGIYLLTKEFPAVEKFGLTNQLRRASVSVCSNIAEGSSRTTHKDQAYFYQLSYSSLMEVLNQLIISVDLAYLDKKSYVEIREKIEKIANMINALRNKRLNN